MKLPADLDAPTVDRLRRFAAAVRASTHNLVSRRALIELESRHIPECVAFARLLPHDGGRILDLGSGGGFPGLVVAIVRPDLEMHLLDATAKKTAFLEATSADLGVEVTVHTGRAEELARQVDLDRAFDVVTARAVAPLTKLVTWSMPFLRPGGLLYAIKGERWEDELRDAEPVIRRLRAQVLATPYDLATTGSDAPRVVMLARGA